MAGQQNCSPSIIAGRLSKAIEFFDSGDHLEDTMPNAAAALYVDAGIAAADVICCIRLGVHSNSGNHNDAIALLKKADVGSERHLATLLALKNKAAYTHEPIGPAECKRMGRAASRLVETAKRAVAARSPSEEQ